jgi:hypothetical protein
MVLVKYPPLFLFSKKKLINTTRCIVCGEKEREE